MSISLFENILRLEYILKFCGAGAWNIVECGINTTTLTLYMLKSLTLKTKIYYKNLSFELYSFVATVYNGEVGNRFNTKYGHWLSSQLWGNVLFGRIARSEKK